IYFDGSITFNYFLQKVIESDAPVKIDSVQAFKLRSMGLIEYKGNEVQSPCNLYRLYFQEHLSERMF
ncbi:MAG: AAA-like domain-containing protein, partial [Cyanobacteria bacterium J06649_11]